jgi:hypothetical protein
MMQKNALPIFIAPQRVLPGSYSGRLLFLPAGSLDQGWMKK